MQKYKFRLTAPSGAFRNVATAADTEDEAVEIVEAQEHKYVGFHLDPRRATELERKFRSGTLSAADRARIVAHQQEKPLTITRRLA